jgi:hypothetical protein
MSFPMITIGSRLSFALLLCLGWLDTASAYFELNTYYYSETVNTGSAATKGRMLVDVSLGFAVDKDGKYQVGWNYSTHSSTDTATTTTTYVSTQMGPRFIWFFTKAKTMNLGVSYNLVTKGTYTPDGGTSEIWNGTGLKADIGYNFAVGESTFLGLRLNYSSASYTSKLVGATDYSESANLVSYIYPSIYLFFSF